MRLLLILHLLFPPTAIADDQHPCVDIIDIYQEAAREEYISWKDADRLIENCYQHYQLK